MLSLFPFSYFSAIPKSFKIQISCYSMPVYLNSSQRVNFLVSVIFFLIWLSNKCVFLKTFFRYLNSVCCNTFISKKNFFPASKYLPKVNKKNTKTRCEICSKLKIKTPEGLQWLVFVFLTFNS